MNRRGLRARLGRVFAAQVAVIGLATVVGVYVTRVVVEDLLTRRVLDLAAEHSGSSRTPTPRNPCRTPPICAATSPRPASRRRPTILDEENAQRGHRRTLSRRERP